MNKKAILSMLIVAVVACIGFASVALADWNPFSDYLWHNFDHGWGKGAVERDDQWYQYWDSGQGRYTYYSIEPTSYGYILVSYDSPLYVYGVKAILNRSDNSQKIYNGIDVMVQQGEDYTKYWPPYSEVFPKPASGETAYLQWSYQWPYYVAPKYNWTNYFYYLLDYEYDYAPH